MVVKKLSILWIKTFFFYALLFLMLGCGNSDSEKIEALILAELDELGYENVLIHCKETNNYLQVDFDFLLNKADKLNSYQTGFQANKLLIKTLVYRLNKLFLEFNGLKFVLHFEEGKKMFIGNSDVINYEMTKADVRDVQVFFDENLLFFDFVNYSFKEVNNTDLVKCEGLILFMNDNLNSFEYQGSFWDLLYDYSLGCNDVKKELKSIYHFISLLIFMNDAGEIRIDGINKSRFNYYLDKCHFDTDLYLNFTIPELFDYLDSKYY